MKRIRKTMAAGSALVVCLTALETSLHAQSILGFDLTEIPNEVIETWAPTNIASGLASDGLLRGPGVNATNLTRGFSARDYSVGDPNRNLAITNGEWIGFNVSVVEGFTASLSTLDLSLRRSALNGPMFFELQYSLDNFVTAGTTIADFTYRGRSSGTSAPTSTTFEEYMKFGVPDPLDPDEFILPPDLAGQSRSTTDPGNPMPTFDLNGFVDLQDIVGGTTVTFGLFTWGNASTTTTNTVAFGRINGPELGGTVIPEPSTYALLIGLGILGVVAIRRRRKA